MKLSNFIADRLTGRENSNKFMRFAQIVAVISVLLGTTALIISLSILNGFDIALKENAIKFSSHITVKSFTREPLPNYKVTIDNIKNNFDEVIGVEPIIEGECLFRTKDEVEGMVIRGVYPEQDIKNFQENMLEGDYNFSNNTAKEIFISKSVSEKMSVAIGDEVVIFAIKLNQNNNAVFPKVTKTKVTGIYETGMSKYDENVIFMPFELAKKLLRIPDNHVSKYEIDIRNIDEAQMFADSLDRFLGYPHFALTVFNIHRAIFSWIELQKEPIPLVLGLISIVAVLNIITTLLILVVEKTNTIGILRTLGMKRIDLIKIFMIKGLKLGLIGTSLGMLVAFTFSILQKEFGLIRLNGELYFLDRLPIDISIDYYIYVALISLILSLFSTFLPALVAVKINPLRAINLK
jgi:lipoprotein-releasing system permease protein